MISEMFSEIAALHDKAARTDLAEQKQRAAEEECERWRKLAESLGARVSAQRLMDRKSLQFCFEIDDHLLAMSYRPEDVVRNMLARAYEEFDLVFRGRPLRQLCLPGRCRARAGEPCPCR